MKCQRLAVTFQPNRPGHILREDGFGICGLNTGDWAGDDIFVVDGILYEISTVSRVTTVIVKEDYYTACKRCLKKIGFDQIKQDELIRKSGNIRPIYTKFEIIDENWVKYKED